MQSNSKALLISQAFLLAGFGTVSDWIPLPRLHWASPSASLDKKNSIQLNKKPLLEKEEDKF